MAMTGNPRDVWVTGVGLLSSLGEGAERHRPRSTPTVPVVEETRLAPYPFHPLAEVDFGKQIPKKSDQRQMELWQRIGVYAAGLALDDAGIARNPELLARTNLIVAAGSGERDTAVDAKVLASMAERPDTVILAKEILPTALRPTLFLAQLSNLLAGNISIVHNVTASSRTFMGEEMAGISAVENAYRRIAAGQADVCLLGGALNAEREDLLLGYELGHALWARPYCPLWERSAEGGGFVPGSVGAFLVVESRAHAEARGAKAYARVTGIVSDRGRREPGEIRRTLDGLLGLLAPEPGAGSLAVLSGASGTEPATGEERDFLQGLQGKGYAAPVRAYGGWLGHTVEAHFPAGIALAALALQSGALFPPAATDFETAFTRPLERVLVTGVGHWRGEALALLQRAD
jgi:3-oxoacyl-[acyl-carrier-protein] synthase II